jgi:hypothetical protein
MENNNIDASKPHVSALIWESILGTSYHADHPEIKKTRGRPRKETAKNVHKMSDEEPENRNLLKSTERKIILDYREYVQEGIPPIKAIEIICDLYRVPYAQVFNICADEL